MVLHRDWGPFTPLSRVSRPGLGPRRVSRPWGDSRIGCEKGGEDVLHGLRKQESFDSRNTHEDSRPNLRYPAPKGTSGVTREGPEGRDSVSRGRNSDRPSLLLDVRFSLLTVPSDTPPPCRGGRNQSSSREHGRRVPWTPRLLVGPKGPLPCLHFSGGEYTEVLQRRSVRHPRSPHLSGGPSPSSDRLQGTRPSPRLSSGHPGSVVFHTPLRSPSVISETEVKHHKK